MATITIRIEDAIRDALQSKAQDAGLSLSEFVRDLVHEAVTPVRDSATPDATPESLSVHDRQTLALLHRILARVLPEGANDVDGDQTYQLDRATVLERGYTAEYRTEFAGIYPELSRRDSARVMDILDMYRMIDFSLRSIKDAGSELSDDLQDRLKYEGFDFNDALEGQMADYVEHLIAAGKWQERRADVEASDGGNSHSQMLDVYLRMLAEYRRILDRRPPSMERWREPLSTGDLQAIAEARVHPSNRSPRRGVRE